ncbi:Si-specific NAD(P)(+) transhydrogenase [Mariniblastus fucicola]|uniref:Soluble pyridine nucleotide transhydrogenase n=1 Tax=Mariniblastus fucicola TaxID=980251 RepID=A0A5B9PM41_9BACT|nr:Si-specific NAD(P)(+) transhydrogenase [Mariniblastus fucicola]QEG23363.1 Soluble pyridine nucleotide transhydrogenase [Mariniblastus fucicola]
MHYDLVVIGTGPSGQKGAIAAAKMGKKVAIVERNRKAVGGVCLHTGTVPSKTIREAILFLTGYRQKEVYGERYSRKRHIQMDDLRKKLSEVVGRERRVILDQLERNFIDIYDGEAAFVNENEIEVANKDRSVRLTADYTLLATGSKPHRPTHIPFDGETVFDSDEILTIERIPRSMIVIGGGVIGIEYGIMFAALGVKITIVDGQDTLLGFCDSEIVDHLMFTARSLGITFRTGESVRSVKQASRNRVIVELESQKKIVGETAFFSVGRKGDTEFLNLAAAGVEVDKRERVKCNENYETSSPCVFAVGDVIGFPALASTSMEQGRQAASRIFERKKVSTGEIPYGLFTIPEIAMVGKTEQELTAEKIPFEIGVSRFEELAKSQICGGHDGLLKLLFHRESRKLLGVHCIGDTATEIIHIGQTIMAFDGTIDYLANAIFNHPTMAESYKVAAFDGLNRLCADVDDCLGTLFEDASEHDVDPVAIPATVVDTTLETTSVS